jgi:signal peptidase I
MDIERSGVEPATAPEESAPESAPTGSTRRERRVGRKRGSRGGFWPALREIGVLIAIAIVLAILLKTFLVQAFFIPSGSMENTLHVYDRVLVNKVVYHLRDIKRGDIIVFNGDNSWTPEVTVTPPSNPVSKAVAWFSGLIGFAPPSETDFIKRVIGLPGDRVACCDAQGRITVNGVALNEGSYLYPGNSPSDTRFSIVVPPDRLWVMGDHRAMSSDSRAHMDDPGGGSIPENEVIGRAFVVIWPIGHWSWLSNPSTFDQPGLSSKAAALGTAALGSPLAMGFVGALPVLPVRRSLRRRRQRALARSR